MTQKSIVKFENKALEIIKLQTRKIKSHLLRKTNTAGKCNILTIAHLFHYQLKGAIFIWLILPGKNKGYYILWFVLGFKIKDILRVFIIG
jgi:hypothetical protein